MVPVRDSGIVEATNEPERAGPSRSGHEPLNFVAADVRRLITPNPKSEIDESLLTSAARVHGPNSRPTGAC